MVMPAIETQMLEMGYTLSNREKKSIGQSVSVTALAGELVAIIGPNGCGKSTLLRSIARLQPVLGGTIYFNGIHANNIKRENFAAMLSFVSTEPVRVLQMTVYQLIETGRFPYTNWLGSMTEFDRHEVNEALKLVGLHEMKHRHITELSDGERQRAMIGRALAQDTPVIVLDEPTAFLDLPNKYDIVHLLHNLAAKKNKTILFSTHDLSIAMDEADKIWLFTNNGVVQGSPEDLIYCDAFNTLFENRLTFDWQTNSYRKNRTALNAISLLGENEKLASLTQKALERIGYMVVADSSLQIAIIESQGIFSWNIKSNNAPTQNFKSIYESINYLKQFRSTKQN